MQVSPFVLFQVLVTFGTTHLMYYITTEFLRICIQGLSVKSIHLSPYP